ncbi:MAG: hypothetical protein K9H64_20430 [Bacteroidales bacterium]|nr:hypothetical protein [Bacteroidales bacterium]MCF8458426.1 hypothetical protein [Bacteroidales bacterium]
MELYPYIYEPDKSIEVYQKTKEFFTSNPDIKNKIEELGWIYNNIGFIIPQNNENFWSGHFFPYTESWDEIQISYTLVCFGLYKQAFVSLRSGLELGLLSVYFNINDDGHIKVKEWLNSRSTPEANTPRAEKIWKILLSNGNICKFNKKHNLKLTYDNFGYLHDYVHSKGMQYSNLLGGIKGNSQTFEPDVVTNWLKGYKDIVILICTLHLLKYPIAVVRFDYFKKFGIDWPSFGEIPGFYIDQITKILPEKFIADIEKIANEDNETQRIIHEIDTLPDMTEKQLEEQIILLEKVHIEHGEGFIKWLEKQEKLLVMLGVSEFDNKMKSRIKILKNWATENGFLESKRKRLGWEIK